MDVTDNSDDLMRRLIIPISYVSINKYQSSDFYKYEFNSSLFDLNYNPYHVLKLHLAIIDKNQNHLSMTQPAIYCTLTRKQGRMYSFIVFLFFSVNLSLRVYTNRLIF